MPFGLCNAPATFERLMDRVLQGLRWSRCLVYLDDIISFGTTILDALDNLTLIFERLRAYDLQLKSSKCHLFQTSVPFLGHISVGVAWNATPGRLRTSSHGRSQTVSSVFVSSWVLSGTIEDSYLTLLTMRPPPPPGGLDWQGRPFCEGSACSDSFYTLRDSLIQAPNVAFPTETGQYILDIDASNFGLGGVLSQIQNNVEHVVAYCSRALRPSQRRYCTTKREMLATVSMCMQFRSYLRGAKSTLRTDHKITCVVTPVQGYRRYDGQMATCPTTIPVFHYSSGR